MVRSIVLLACLAVFSGSAVPGQDTGGVSWRRQVAPLLQKYCTGCHNAAEPEHGLSLQSPAEIRRGGDDGVVLNTEKPADSRLLQVLVSTGDDHMPPASEAQPTTAELALLQQWIRSGGPFDGPADSLLNVPRVPVTSTTSRSAVFSLAVSSDGNTLAVGRFRSVTLLNSRNLSSIATLPVEDGKVTDLAFLPDQGGLLAATGVTGFSGRVLLLNPEQGALLREYAGSFDMVYAVARTASGVIAAGGYDRRIRLYAAQDGRLLRELVGHNGAVFDLAFSPDGNLLASASADGTVKVWHVASGERLDTLSQPLAEQYAVLFSPDGQFILAAGADNRIRRWRVVSRTAPQINPLVDSRFAHEGAIQKLAISADGRFLASAAEDGTLKLWDAATLQELSSQGRDQDPVTAMVFLDQPARLLAGTSRGELTVSEIPAPISVPSESTPAAPVAAAPTEARTPVALKEHEPNETGDQAMALELPAVISGVIHAANAETSDVDVYRFEAKAGQQLLLETRAARDKSPVDTRLEVLDVSGRPILQTRLQAVRDSYFTFRGKDSETVDDFRMFNWQEMDLNEYLYADGEVVRLWMYPRGPDSGFKVYPGSGQRYTYFGTTATAHALQAPAFIVVPHAPDDRLTENGLPVFPVYFENDDDPLREWGRDSRLVFQAPSAGPYLVRVSDARGFSGQDFSYQLTLRDPRPNFRVTLGSDKVRVHQGAGAEMSFTVQRIDGFSGPVEIDVEGLPPGFTSSLPVQIQQDQQQTLAILMAAEDAVPPDADALKKIRFVARALINGVDVEQDAGGLAELNIAGKPKVRISVHSAEQLAAGVPDHTPELVVYAGETTRAFVRVARNEFTGLVELGKEDSGRNMPHGVFVDNIGLNGLMILQNQQEREFFITVAGWVPETSRMFHLKTNVDGGITSKPVMLHVRHRDSGE